MAASLGSSARGSPAVAAWAAPRTPVAPAPLSGLSHARAHAAIAPASRSLIRRLRGATSALSRSGSVRGAAGPRPRPVAARAQAPAAAAASPDWAARIATSLANASGAVAGLPKADGSDLDSYEYPVLAQNLDAVFVYGNRAALDRFETDLEQLCATLGERSADAEFRVRR